MTHFHFHLHSYAVSTLLGELTMLLYSFPVNEICLDLVIFDLVQYIPYFTHSLLILCYNWYFSLYLLLAYVYSDISAWLFNLKCEQFYIELCVSHSAHYVFKYDSLLLEKITLDLYLKKKKINRIYFQLNELFVPISIFNSILLNMKIQRILLLELLEWSLMKCPFDRKLIINI